MKYILLILFSVFIVGCSDNQINPNSIKVELDVADGVMCNTQELKEKVLTFVVKCSEAANPKSDEEGEDLVQQCEKTAKSTLCPVVKICRLTYNHQSSVWKECDEKSLPYTKYIDPPEVK